eukprot:1189908-Prorocentrum_minimum.AAC.4
MANANAKSQMANARAPCPGTEYECAYQYEMHNKAYAYLRCRGMNAYNDTASFTGTRLTEHVTGYQDDLHTAYHVLALGRFHIVSEVLELGHHIIFTDTDVVMIRDPITMLLEQPYDVMFLWDGGDTADKTTYLLGRGTAGAKGEIQSNAGYFFARNNDRTRAWFKHVRAMMDQEASLRAQGKGRRNDQQIISHSLENSALQAAGAKDLKWKLMPRDALVNGWLIKNMYKDGVHRTGGCLATGPGALSHTKNWMVIHMNYNRGPKRKVTHFKRGGHHQQGANGLNTKPASAEQTLPRCPCTESEAPFPTIPNWDDPFGTKTRTAQKASLHEGGRVTTQPLVTFGLFFTGNLKLG